MEAESRERLQGGPRRLLGGNCYARDLEGADGLTVYTYVKSNEVRKRGKRKRKRRLGFLASCTRCRLSGTGTTALVSFSQAFIAREAVETALTIHIT